VADVHSDPDEHGRHEPGAMMDDVETVARHRTAMSRTMLSRPLQQAFDDGLLDGDVTVFDYGCGRGDDVRTLGRLGVTASGWDPAHAGDAPQLHADVVNLGYVVNVIENQSERAEALEAAWALAKSVLVVSARLVWDPDAESGTPYRDGRLTRAGTFQKFYAPEEFKAWVEVTLRHTSVTAAPGVLYVFRHVEGAQRLLAHHSRHSSRPRQGVAELLYQQARPVLAPLESFVDEHRRLPSPPEVSGADAIIGTFGSIRAAFGLVRRATGTKRWTDIDLGTRKRSERRFEEKLDDLQPLIDFVTDRGRLPREGELANEPTLVAEFGSVRAAFSLIRRVTGPARWLELESAAKENFLVYAALAAFGGRPRFSELPGDLQYDAKDLYGSYSAACAEADRLLYSIADLDAINQACTDACFGKLTPEALYVHAAYVNELPTLLRVYEGAARRITGDVDDASVIKLNRLKPQVSFLVYPGFETDPHPAIEASIVAKLGEIRVRYRYFGDSGNPAILHRKELFVPDHHPTRAKFARLTAQEERAGLLDRADIGTLRAWRAHLAEAGLELQGHRLVKASGSHTSRPVC
jgi:hypothetical protein